MFSLIISVISIALVVVLIAATSYYGGDTLGEGKKQADAAALMNQAQQVSTAAEMFASDNPGVTISAISELQPTYLHSTPQGWDVSLNPIEALKHHVIYPVEGNDFEKMEICESVNKKISGSVAIPSCSAVPSAYAGCCDAD